MIVWFFTGIWHALVGLVMLIGFLGGAVFVVGKAIGEGRWTDHAPHCQCGPCQKRRLEAYRAEARQNVKNKIPIASGTIPTSALRVGDRVEAKGVTYEVTNLLGQPGMGTRVFMTNMANGKKTMVFIRTPFMEHKIWKLVN